jgi:Flp pilus assembly protein TadD
VTTWRDTEALWHHALAVTTDNYKAHEMLGLYYQDCGQLDRAEYHLAEAVRIIPDSPTYRMNLALVLDARGQEEAAEMHLRTALEFDRDFVRARMKLAELRDRRQAPLTPAN